MIPLLVFAVIAACIMPVIVFLFALSEPSTEQDLPAGIISVLILLVILVVAIQMYEHRFEPLVPRQTNNACVEKP